MGAPTCFRSAQRSTRRRPANKPSMEILRPSSSRAFSTATRRRQSVESQPAAAIRAHPRSLAGEGPRSALPIGGRDAGGDEDPQAHAGFAAHRSRAPPSPAAGSAVAAAPGLPPRLRKLQRAEGFARMPFVAASISAACWIGDRLVCACCAEPDGSTQSTIS